MKIVEIIPQLSSGGAERFVVDLCNELSLRHEVTLIVYHGLAEHGFYAGEVSERVNLISLEKKNGFSAVFFRKVYEAVKRAEPDVVHLHTRALNYAFPLVWMKQRPAMFMTIHNDAEREAGGFFGTMLRKSCFARKAIVPVTISRESAASFRRFYGSDAPMIFNGRNVDSGMTPSPSVEAEFAKYRKTPDTRVLVSLARFTDVKRQDMLARTVARLENEGYDVCALLIGRQHDPAVVAGVLAAGSANVHMLGEKTNPLEYLCLADAFCLCSLYEGMPISLIEAMGMGVIPVCTPAGGVADVVDGQIGFLSDDLSEDAYYSALKRYLETDENTLADMRKRLLKAYELYGMSECASRYESLFKEQKNG